MTKPAASKIVIGSAPSGPMSQLRQLARGTLQSGLVWAGRGMDYSQGLTSAFNGELAPGFSQMYNALAEKAHNGRVTIGAMLEGISSNMRGNPPTR